MSEGGGNMVLADRSRAVLVLDPYPTRPYHRRPNAPSSPHRKAEECATFYLLSSSCTITTTAKSRLSPRDDGRETQPIRSQTSHEVRYMRIPTLVVLVAASVMASSAAFAQLSKDDVKWINQCIADNKGAAADGVIR